MELILRCDVCDGFGELKHLRGGGHAYSERCMNCYGKGHIPNPAVLARLAALTAEVERLRAALVDERVRCAKLVVIKDREPYYLRESFSDVEDAILDGTIPGEMPPGYWDGEMRAEHSLASILGLEKDNNDE